MKNTKLIALGLVSTLFIVSCGKKVEEKTTNTGVTSTGVVASTGTILNTGTVNNEVSSGKVEENSTGTSVVIPVSEIEEKQVGENNVLTNSTVGYELTYKRSEDFSQQKQQGIDLFLVTKTGNMFSSVTSPFSEKTLDEFLTKGIDEMKAQIPDIKKEETTINGVKGYKLTYVVDKISFEQYVFEGKNKNAILLSKTFVDKTSENFDSIVNSFKLTK